jgi:hypothetical protein
VAEVMDDHQLALQQERKNFDFELSAKETQMKVAHSIAISNIEKKHQTVLDELESSHKRTIEELKNTHTKNALAAKKDAESQRNAEILKLKGIHADELKQANDTHVAELAQSVLNMNVQRMNELKSLSEEHEVIIKAKNDEISQFMTNIESLEVKAQVLRCVIIYLLIIFRPKCNRYWTKSNPCMKTSLHYKVLL